MGVIKVPGGWWEFEGNEPPGLIVSATDEGGDHDTVHNLLRVEETAARERHG